MRWSPPLVLCVCLGGSGMTLPDDPPAAPKPDLEKIQGTWIQTKAVHAQQGSGTRRIRCTLDIRGDKVIASQFDFPEQKIGEYKFSLDEKKKPKWFTWTLDNFTQQGIYELKDDELTITFKMSDKKFDQRPEDFIPRRGSDMYVFKARQIAF